MMGGHRIMRLLPNVGGIYPPAKKTRRCPMVERPASTPCHGSYINIYDWMPRKYHLAGDDLIIYAVIHSFSRDGVGVFSGSLRYLAYWTGRTKPTNLRILNRLLETGLINKMKVPCTRLTPNRHYCRYWTVHSRLPREQQKIIENS